MAPTTPAEWLPILAKMLDDAQPDVSALRSYVNGNAPLPEMGKNTRATWLAFQRKARTNLGGIACRSHSNRIVLQRVRVGSDDGSPASVAARRIFRDNRLPMVVSSAVWDMLSTRRGYLVAGLKPDGRAVITSEKPEQFYAEPDPLYPWKTRAGIKVFRDVIAETDHAMVWGSGQFQSFQRPSFTLTGAKDRVVRMVNSGGWEPASAPIAVADIPIWILDRDDGMGLVEPHVDVIDRINLGKLQRLCVTAMQAFKQRAVKGDLPTVDPVTNQPIDYEAVFEPAPGSMWNLPAEFDIWESQTTDIRPMLDAEKADARDFAAVTGTPVSMLTPDSANQSATGAAATTAQQVDACNADIQRIRLAVAAAVMTALQIEGVDFGEDTVEADFENPAWVTLAEKMDAYSKAIAAGMSPQVAQKLYLGWSPELIEEDDANRRKTQARELAASLAGTPVVTSGNAA